MRGLLYGETVTLSLLNPIDGREVKCWYVNGEKLEGNTFSMLDENVVAIAKQVQTASISDTSFFIKTSEILWGKTS